ncbi:hypothetical protein TBR22_A01370 [Luteitalea sp. TBR-22]|uniref:MFS transporter n=1 Tax=Luteitalea sp. TBR-22 TaxID=2802971 RepID=UPI001AF77300|nr:MFS transporter [Luteitalea sp. TBR-22]BCS30936.1 hypothetical protein TBR22_A01370 [Luteitalea sp. TBR-22]
MNDSISRQVRAPWRTCAVLGLGGLFAGVTGPLLSTFVPVVVRATLGDARTLIGLVMAIDNVLLLLLVPWAGAWSDRAVAHGARRTTLIVAGFLLAALGMALFPWAGRGGLVGVIAAMVVLYAGINIQRSPLQALLADAVPSRYRSLATGSVTFQMCVGAIAFLMLGRALGMHAAFLAAAATVVGIAAALRAWVVEPAAPSTPAIEATGRSLLVLARDVLVGSTPGLRPVFVASLLLQLTFQTFTTWFALHGTERFGVSPGDVTIGFIAWAIGGVIGALPAGLLGVRLGRRATMLAGLTVMALALVALDRVTTLGQAVPLLMLTSAAWTLPMVNAYPMFVEPIGRGQRGSLSAVFLLSMALGGAIGDPLNGRVFDLAGSYRWLFLVMAAYAALAAVAVWLVPRGCGEAGASGS